MTPTGQDFSEMASHLVSSPMRLGPCFIAATVFTSACSHTCSTHSFYKPSVQRAAGVELSDYPPDRALFSIKDAAFSVSICGNQYLPPPRVADSVCVVMALGPRDTLRFGEPSLTLLVPGGDKQTLPLGNIEYEMFCQASPQGPRCSSSLASPTSEPVQKLRSNTSMDRYGFSSALAFSGAADTLHEGAWFGVQGVGKRRYLARVQLGSLQDAKELVVQLPKVFLNGEPFMPPELRFTAVTEELCRTLVLQ